MAARRGVAAAMFLRQHASEPAGVRMGQHLCAGPSQGFPLQRKIFGCSVSAAQCHGCTGSVLVEPVVFHGEIYRSGRRACSQQAQFQDVFKAARTRSVRRAGHRGVAVATLSVQSAQKGCKKWASKISFSARLPPRHLPARHTQLRPPRAGFPQRIMRRIFELLGTS